MRLLSKVIYINIIALFPLNSAFGQEGKLRNLDSLKGCFIAQLTDSELFDSFKYYPSNQRKIQSFNFLKEYEFKTHDYSKYYIFDDNDLIPYQITYYNPTEYYHLKEELFIIKKRKK